MAKVGRKSDYSEALADSICSRLTNGESLRTICAESGIAHRSTVIRWYDKHPGFATRCARAMQESADSFLDKQIEISQQVVEGKIDPQAAKVAISTYQWIASKRAPKKYGDRLELAGDKDNPITVMSVAETLRQRFQRRLASKECVTIEKECGTNQLVDND